jgi:tetratricopeptide (TPR) repeat protein
MICKRFGFALASLLLLGLPFGATPLVAQEAVSRLPEVDEAFKQGTDLLAEEKFSEAIGPLNKAISLDKSFAQAYIAKGDALKGMELYPDAGTAYSQALDLNPPDIEAARALNGRGECYMEMSPPDYNLALVDFQKSLNLNRGDASALSNLGHVLVASGQESTTSIRILDEAITLNPEDARAFRDRGMARAQMREFDKAVADLQKAAQLAPDDYENYSTLSTIQSRFQDDYAGAAESMSRAIETYKPKKLGDPEVFIAGYILRADARLKVAEKTKDAAEKTTALEGAIDDADAVLAQYEDRFPESGLALFRRGRAERMLERYSKSVDSLTKAIQLIPGGQDVEYLSDAYLYRGICFFHMGTLGLARGDFEQASATGSGFSDPRVYLWIGFTYHKQGDFRQAIDFYSQATAKASGFALAHINKGLAYMDLREYDKAIESFSRAISSEPEVGDHYYYVAKAYLELRQFETAREFFDLALLKDNPKPAMYQGMAEALRGLGRNDLAERYEREAQSPPTSGSRTSS